MNPWLEDVDPGDETTVQHPEATGLCARPWCDDAALPGFDFCANCEGEIEVALQEMKKNAELWENAIRRAKP